MSQSTTPEGEQMSESEDNEPDYDFQFNTNVGYLDNFLEGLEAMRDEGVMVIKDDNIYSSVIDPANVAMCIAKIEGRALNRIDTADGGPYKIGVRFERVREMLKGTSSSSEVEITYPIMEEGGAVNIRINIIDEDLIFDIPLIDIDSVPKMPDKDPISCETRVVVSGTDLKKSITHGSKIVDPDTGAIRLETEGNVFRITTRDKVEGTFKKEFRQGGPTDSGTLGSNRVEIAFSYLNDAQQVVGRGQEVEIHIDDDFPVRMDVELDEDGDAKLIYVIAPRIDDQ